MYLNNQGKKIKLYKNKKLNLNYKVKIILFKFMIQFVNYIVLICYLSFNFNNFILAGFSKKSSIPDSYYFIISLESKVVLE